MIWLPVLSIAFLVITAMILAIRAAHCQLIVNGLTGMAPPQAPERTNSGTSGAAAAHLGSTKLAMLGLATLAALPGGLWYVLSVLVLWVALFYIPPLISLLLRAVAGEDGYIWVAEKTLAVGTFLSILSGCLLG